MEDFGREYEPESKEREPGSSGEARNGEHPDEPDNGAGEGLSGEPEDTGDWLLLNFGRLPYFSDETSPVSLDVVEQSTRNDEVLLVFDRAENRGAPEDSQRAFSAVFSSASPGIEDMLAKLYMKPKSFFCRPDAWAFVIDADPSSERLETYRRAGAEVVSDIFEARSAVEELHRAGGPDAVGAPDGRPPVQSGSSPANAQPASPQGNDAGANAGADDEARPLSREERREMDEGPEGSGSGSVRGASGAPGSSLGRKSTADRTRVALTSGPPRALSTEDIEALDEYRRVHEPEGRLQQFKLDILKGLKLYNPPPRPQVGGRPRYRRMEVDDALTIRNAEWPAIACLLANKGGVGKCNVWNMKITNPVTGVPRTIEEVVRSEETWVNTLKDYREVKKERIAEHIDSGVQPTLRLVTKSGRHIEVTYHHPMLMAGGWRQAQNIEVGETLAAAAREPFPEEVTALPDAEVDMLAALMAEGGTSGESVTFTNADSSIVESIQAAAEALGMRLSPMKKYSGDPRYYVTNADGAPPGTKSNWGAVRRFTEEHLLRGKLAKEKRMPEAVFRLGPEQLSRFLSIFWMCDGYVAKNTGPGTTLSSKGLVEDIQHLLLRFGIQSKVAYKSSSYTTKDGERRTFDGWRLSVYSQYRARFRDCIPLWGEKRERLDEICLRRNNPNAGAPTVTEELKGDIHEAVFGTRKGSRGGGGHISRRSKDKDARCVEAVDGAGAAYSGATPLATAPEAHTGPHSGAEGVLDAPVAPTIETPPSTTSPSTKDVKEKLGWSAFQFSLLFDRPTKNKRFSTISVRPFKAFIETFGLEDEYGWLVDEDSDIFWDEVVAVEDAGEQQVYDLSVEPTRNFVANDLIVHNTTCALNLSAALSRIVRPKAWEPEGLQVLLVDQNFGNSDVRAMTRTTNSHPLGLTDYLMDLDTWQSDSEEAAEAAAKAAADAGEDPSDASREVWAAAAKKRPEIVRYVSDPEGLDNLGVLFVSGEGQEYEHEGMIDERQLEELHASISRYYDVVVVDLDKGLPQEGTPGALVMRFWAATADVGFLMLDDSLPSFEQGGAFVDAARRILDQDTDDPEMRLPLVPVRNRVRDTGFDATWDSGAQQLGADRLWTAEGSTEPYLRIPDDGQLAEFARERRFIALSSVRFKRVFEKMAIDFLKRAIGYRKDD